MFTGRRNVALLSLSQAATLSAIVMSMTLAAVLGVESGRGCTAQCFNQVLSRFYYPAGT